MTVEKDIARNRPLQEPSASGSTETLAEKGSLKSSAARLLLITLAAVFLTEAGVMAVLAMLPPQSPVVEAVIDSTILSILVFPILYLTISRPLLKQIESRRRAEGALERANAELDHRVRERTSELAAANSSLRENEERYRTILQTAQDGFWIIDPKGIIVDVNDSYCRLSGYLRDELIGRHISMVEANEDKTDVDLHVERIMTQIHERFETRHRHKDGEVFDVDVSVTFLPLEGGLMFTFLRDITDRKRDTAELVRRRAELEAIINSNADAIVFTDTQRQIALVNPAFERMFGYSAAEVFGRKTHFLDLEPRPPEGVPDDDDDRRRGSFEIQCRRKDGTSLWVETQAVAVRDSRGRLFGFVGVHRDVSERRRAEGLIRASLQEKNVLLKEIHHRVKNNLQVIASMLHLQADKVQNEAALAPLRESQNRIRSLALIHEKLYRSPDIAHIDFNDYVSDLAKSVVSSVNRTPNPIVVDTVIDDVVFGIDTAIPVALIVNELVSNSVKHAFHGSLEGHIHISLNPVGDGRFRLVVEDNGIGLPADLDSSTSPTLGLQLVEVLTAQLDGTLTWGSDEGTRFEIVFVGTDAGGNET